MRRGNRLGSNEMVCDWNLGYPILLRHCLVRDTRKAKGEDTYPQLP